MFDCALLEIDWNDALATRLSEEEIRSASGSMKGVEDVRDWYPTDQNMSWPLSVLSCQRANAVWARRQHSYYGRTLYGMAIAWGLIGMVVAVIDGASLASYLVTVGLPSLPALLDAVEFARGHFSDAERRQVIETRLNSLVQAPSAATEQDIREVQDQLFQMRRDAQLVPKWFYKLLRPRFEQDMRYAAGRLREGA